MNRALYEYAKYFADKDERDNLIMLVEDSHAKKFVPDRITKKKKTEIIGLAERIRSAKNVMSVFVFQHFDFFFNNITSKFQFYDYIINALKIDLPSQVKTEAIEDVYVKYDQRRDNIKKFLLGLDLTHYNKTIYYKKSVKKGPYTYAAGTLKDVKYKHEKTEYTIFAATLSLFIGDDKEKSVSQFMSYINKNIKKTEEYIVEVSKDGKIKIKERESKLKRLEKTLKHFRRMLLIASDEAKFNRYYNIARSRHERVMKHYTEPIRFNTLNFRARSKVQNFLDKNRNSVRNFNKRKHNSVINAFFDLGGLLPDRKHLYIPVKHSNTYHGSLADYRKTNAEDAHSNTYNYQYMILFDSKKDFVIQVTKKELVEWTNVTDDMIVIGGDLNMKHNLEQFSDGTSIDWPRKNIDELIKLELRIDKALDKRRSEENEIKKIKKQNERLPAAERTSFREHVTEVKNLNNTISQLKTQEKQIQKTIDLKVDREISAKLKSLNSQFGEGNVHLVLENIDGKFGSNPNLRYETAAGNDYALNKIMRLCHFGDVKDRTKRIARKYHIPVSFVPSYYTSQICPECGHIDRDNRKTQEDFKCVECGYSAPADSKSSKIISLYPMSTVLTDSLLKRDVTGAFVPKKGLNKEKVL